MERKRKEATKQQIQKAMKRNPSKAGMLTYREDNQYKAFYLHRTRTGRPSLMRVFSGKTIKAVVAGMARFGLYPTKRWTKRDFR